MSTFRRKGLKIKDEKLSQSRAIWCFSMWPEIPYLNRFDLQKMFITRRSVALFYIGDYIEVYFLRAGYSYRAIKCLFKQKMKSALISRKEFGLVHIYYK